MEQQESHFTPHMIGGFMARAGKAMHAALQHRFKQAGIDLSLDQWVVLMHLWVEDGQNQAALGETAGRNKTTVTRAIDGLERKNFVVRVLDKDDRRNKLIYLTQGGKEMEQRTLPHAQAVEKQALAGISEEKIALYKEVLMEITKNLQPDT